MSVGFTDVSKLFYLYPKITSMLTIQRRTSQTSLKVNNGKVRFYGSPRRCKPFIIFASAGAINRAFNDEINCNYEGLVISTPFILSSFSILIYYDTEQNCILSPELWRHAFTWCVWNKEGFSECCILHQLALHNYLVCSAYTLLRPSWLSKFSSHLIILQKEMEMARLHQIPQPRIRRGDTFPYHIRLS